MLFNSLAFILGFLPLVLWGYRTLARAAPGGVVLVWLAVASLGFYAMWDARFLYLLVVQIGLNHLVSAWLPNRVIFVIVLTLNLSVLGLFKYADFFFEVVGLTSGMQWPRLGWELPLGISFFTFTQIAFLVDVQRGLRTDRSFLRFLLFVTWFPHLVAGPVIHHAAVMPHLQSASQRLPKTLMLQAGLTLFVIGLAKKVLLADSFARFADAAFAAADAAEPLDILSAWSGLLSYSLQLYFDFSGYSDMACGLSLMFGVPLPINFDSPYKATGIVDFWRRWHMTLSRFLRDYLYVPLGGNRCSTTRHYFNVLCTMVLGGLWHGASWNFLLWGSIHGLLLIAHRSWLRYECFRVPTPLAVLATFLVVSLAWIPFRASSFPAALQMWGALWDPTSFAGWSAVGDYAESILNRWSTPAGIVEGLRAVDQHSLSELRLGAGLPALAIGLSIVWALPNSAQIVKLKSVPSSPSASCVRWRPNRRWAILVGCLFGLCLIDLDRYAPFLYFQF